MANSALWPQRLSSFNYVDSGGAIPDLPALPLPQFVSGFKRKINKIGKLFDKPASMVDDEEFWARVYKTVYIPGWPSEIYPLIMYSSSDHSTGNGGIYVRVWRKADGPLTDGAAWHEWQNVSNETWFDHIVQKTNPIYYKEVQTETPQMIVDQGLVYLFTHDGAVNAGSEYGGNVQATTYATGSNGIDFTYKGIINAYNPKLFSGNGHGGYFDVGLNKNPAIPFKWIAKQTKGGGFDNRGPSVRIVGSNTLSARYWTEIADVGRMQGQLKQYSPAGKEDWIYIPENPHNQIKEGAYWKIKGTFRPNVVTGGVDAGAVPCEFLVDDYFNFVSEPNVMAQLGSSGEFDDAEIQNFHELEYEGVVYGFYKAMQNGASVSSIGICTVTEEAADWEIFNPLSQRAVQQSYASDGVNLPTGLAVTPSLSNYDLEGLSCVSLLLDMDESESSIISTQGITPKDHDIIDVMFKNIGKDTSDAMLVEFGLTDSLTAPTVQFNYRWNPRATATTSAARSEKMAIDTLGTSSDGTTLSRNYFGQSGGRNSDKEQDESSQSRHNVGLRLVPATGQLIVLEGVAGQEIIDISGFDYNKPLYVFIKAKLDSSLGADPATADAAVTFEKIDLITYSADAVAVPQAPSLATSKTSESIALSTNTVPGATGYKFFLDNQQNETGSFTGLEPETTYTVYARAFNTLGDSAPSAIQTVTTDEAIPVNQPPIANAGPNQSVAAATQFTLDGTGSQDTDGTIVEWRWTQTAGDTVTLDQENPARPTATAPSKTTAQRLTFQLVTVDDEGAVSSPSLVNIDVAAVVQNDVLNIIDKISFTFESDGMITAFPGRANRETFRLKPSDPTGLVLEDGWFDFEANDVRRVEISMLETTGVKIISTDTDSITREKSKLHARMGDMPIKSSTKEFEPTVSVFVGNDERGVVMTAPGLSGAPKVKYYSTTARAV
ncbi:MAG: hypothetical protein ACI8R0_002888 [Alteromonadales bacterium]|jgi:hypothetical protein